MKTKTFIYLFEEGTKDGRPRDLEGKLKKNVQKIEKAATQMNQVGVEVDV